ncbi:MAG: gluconate 2-dehydrogenase subunit 3 family protein [Bauldia sp.]|nr:gluconate 2-dehydrogenase subunit 3 family protein [Bauldia sp.]
MTKRDTRDRDRDAPSALSRRDLFKAAAAAGVVAAVPTVAAGQESAPAPSASPAGPPAAAPGAGPVAQAPAARPVLFFFNDEEARFVEAAIDRLIPADPEWPGAVWAGVLTFIDRQLAGPYGDGAKTYLAGPWTPDAPPEQGYQHRYTPAEIFRIGIAEVRAHVTETRDAEFAELGADAIDAVLTALEAGEIELPSIPSALFFSVLLDNTVQGWFADPVHGGNRDMVSWRMVGFPGAYAQYLETVDIFNLDYRREPVSIADAAARAVHLGGHHEH